jgi:hypothetical protein
MKQECKDRDGGCSDTFGTTSGRVRPGCSEVIPTGALAGYPVMELDGGWKEWQRHNLPIEPETPRRQPAVYRLDAHQEVDHCTSRARAVVDLAPVATSPLRRGKAAQRRGSIHAGGAR